jgi:hypothetical protein
MTGGVSLAIWMGGVAREIDLPRAGKIKMANRAATVEPVDRSPQKRATGPRKVLEKNADFDALLGSCPVPRETLSSDRGSPLMVRTLAKAASTTTATVSSVRQIPGPVRPAVTTAHTLALGGYRVTNTVKAVPRYLILSGTVLLALGIAAATQSAILFGSPD